MGSEEGLGSRHRREEQVILGTGLSARAAQAAAWTVAQLRLLADASETRSGEAVEEDVLVKRRAGDSARKVAKRLHTGRRGRWMHTVSLL